MKIEDINYRITDIRSRSGYAAGFIFRKINAHPEKFDGAVFVLPSEKPEDLVEKIKSMTDRTEQTETLLNLYHFKANQTGLPIDTFINGDYDRYIDALRMLLHAKDQAFYTGFPIYEDEEKFSGFPRITADAADFLSIVCSPGIAGDKQPAGTGSSTKSGFCLRFEFSSAE